MAVQPIILERLARVEVYLGERVGGGVVEFAQVGVDVVAKPPASIGYLQRLPAAKAPGQGLGNGFAAAR